jgi:hypothetical protein
MIPAPWIYLAAAGLGLVLGVILDASLGWPWWAVALGVVAAVWLLFLSSVFMGPARGDRLGGELLDAVNPHGAVERRRKRESQLIRSCPFSLYGLDASWTGPRLIGGLGMRGGRLTGAELTHGEPNRGPWVRIETAPFSRERHFDLKEVAADLWFGMEQHPPPDLSPGERREWTNRRFQERRARNTQWAKGSIPVDGQPTEFDVLDEETDWAARGALGDLVVTIHAHHVTIESIRLAVVTNVEPYVEGDQRLWHGE